MLLRHDIVGVSKWNVVELQSGSLVPRPHLSGEGLVTFG